MDFMLDCFGFAALLVIAIVFFGVVSSIRRRQRERMEETAYGRYAPPTTAVAAAPPGGVCPRCNTANPGEAVFCRQCGLSLRQSPPPYPPPSAVRRTSPRLLYFIFALIGLLGVAAWLFTDSKPSRHWDDDDDDRRPRKSYRHFEH